jgi:ABC-type nitrate/sulfonate/bicarbonate transport system substrate-binding protein
MTKAALIAQKPQVITAYLRAHVLALRLAKANKALAVQTLVDRLKYEPKYAARAYDEAMPDFDERGRVPERAMPIFWQLSIAQGIVKAPLPERDLIDSHYIDTFAAWAPRG